MSDKRPCLTPVIVGAVIALLGILTGLYIADNARQQQTAGTVTDTLPPPPAGPVPAAVEAETPHPDLSDLPPLDPVVDDPLPPVGPPPDDFFPDDNPPGEPPAMDPPDFHEPPGPPPDMDGPAPEHDIPGEPPADPGEQPADEAE